VVAGAVGYGIRRLFPSAAVCSTAAEQLQQLLLFAHRHLLCILDKHQRFPALAANTVSLSL